MAAENYIFDPDGDLLLILSQPTLKKDAEEEEEEEEKGDASNGTTDNASQATDSSSVIEVTFLVSSKHMILASPVFKAMLRPNHFLEGSELAGEGRVEVPLPDDNPGAFKLLLQIIHHRTRELPRTIDLDMLFAFTMLADKYQMVETVEIFAQRWVEDLKKIKPKAAKACKWLTIAWVLELPTVFTEVTQQLQLWSDDTLTADLEGFPIPTPVIIAIEDSRLKVMAELLEYVHCIIQKLQAGKTYCDSTDLGKIKGSSVDQMQFACDSLLLGTLQRSMQQASLYPLPPKSLNGICFKVLTCQLELLDIHGLCQGRFFAGSREDFDFDHGLQKKINSKIKATTKRLKGLDINSFKGDGGFKTPVKGSEYGDTMLDKPLGRNPRAEDPSEK